MALIRWEPWRDLERFFDTDMMRPLGSLSWDLAVDVFEEEGNVIAEMNLPGIDPDKLDISVEGDRLRISGSREEKEEKKDKNYYSREISRGSFERAVQLPAEVEGGRTEASYEKGVLRVVMPKKEERPSEKIKVRVK